MLSLFNTSEIVPVDPDSCSDLCDWQFSLLIRTHFKLNIMSRFKHLGIILFIILIFDVLFFHLFTPAKFRDSIYVFYFMVMIILIFLFIMTLTYKTVFDFKSSFWIIILSVLLSFIFSGFIAGRLRDISKYYEMNFFGGKKTSVGDNLHYLDALGVWRGIPNARGEYYYSVGDSIKGSVEVFFDSLGHKNVSKDKMLISDTLDLFVGCSFTFGMLLAAEDGYPYIVSRSLNHGMMNLSMGGFGLAQMRLRMDSLLPAFKFRYVFIQMSPWLAERSMRMSGIFARGLPPIHYFSDTKGGIRMMPFAYEASDYSNLDKWEDGHVRSYPDRLKYLFTSGYELQIRSYLIHSFAKLKTKLGILPKPISDKLKLETFFYDKAIADVRKSGAIPVLVKMYWDDKDFSPLKKHLSGKALLVDCDYGMDSVARQSTLSRQELFTLYKDHNGKKIQYDVHPNEFANKLIAADILAKISTAK